MTLPRVEMRTLRCELGEADLRNRRAALAAAEVELAALARRLKSSKAIAADCLDTISGSPQGAAPVGAEERYASERIIQRQIIGTRKLKTEEASALVEALARGWEVREVEVSARLIGGDVASVRTDTGEIIDRSVATENEIREFGEEIRRPGED